MRNFNDTPHFLSVCFIGRQLNLQFCNYPYRASNWISRFVRILYRIRKPHCLQRTGSPPLIKFLAPQSPHLYSTPRIAVPREDDGVDPGWSMSLMLPNLLKDILQLP